MNNKTKRLALRVSLSYCLAAGLWILCSDRVLFAFISDPQLLGTISMFKGLAFVFATTPLLYLALRNQLRRWEQEAGKRLQAEEKVRPLSQAVEQSPISIVITDTCGNIEYVNRKFTEVTGYSFAEAVGRNPRMLKSGELSAEKYKEMWETITGGGTWSGEFHNRKKDGGLYWEWAVISPVLDAAGKPSHFLAVKEDITQRKQAGEELIWKTAFLEAQVDSALDGILVVDNQAKKILQNRRMTEMWKIPPHIAENKDDASQIKFVAGQTKNSGQFMDKIAHLNSHPDEVSRDEIELIDGTVLDRYSSPVRDNAGKYYGRIWTFRDITDRRRNEKALQESERHYRSLFENMLNGFAFCRMESDADGSLDFTYLKVNPKFETLTGLKNVEGRKATEVIPGVRETDSALLAIYDRVARTGVPEQFEMHVKALKMWFAIAVYSPKPGHFVAVFDVITQRKQAEEKLRASEERFRLLTENASDIVSVVNGRGVLRFQSPSAERLLGYKPEETIGRSAFEFIHPEDAACVAAALERTLSDSSNPVTAEFRFRHRNGSWHILQTIGRSIPNQADDGFIVINARDITENRKLEEQLRQSQKMESFGQLAGGVAHDFNNILAVIQMQADLLKADGSPSPGRYDFATQIGAAAQRGAALTRQLLLFSRKQTLQPRDLDLNESINEMTKMLRRTLGENVQLEFRFAMQPLFIRADPGMLDQVLMNLAVNARDAMLPQARDGQIVIKTSAVDFDELASSQSPQARPGAFVCLSVSDNGCGIPPEILPRIFEPFFSTKGVGKGTGLGLATAFGIIQQHQGWINVYSEAGRGTTFRIYLPRLAKISEQQPAQPALTSMPGGDETILFAEDDPFLRASVREALSQLGYRVLDAVNGIEALEIWKQRRDEVDLLLTDLIMPGGMTGKDLGERLLKESPKLKVIYTSGYSPEIAGRDFQLREGVNYLAKPFEAGKLAQTVRQKLDAES